MHKVNPDLIKWATFQARTNIVQRTHALSSSWKEKLDKITEKRKNANAKNWLQNCNGRPSASASLVYVNLALAITANFLQR